MKSIVKKFSILLAGVVLGLGIFAGNAMAMDGSPDGVTQAADLILARPLLLVGTAVGVVGYVVTLPVTYPLQSADQAGYALVTVPFKNTFERCLGCSVEN